MRLVYSTIRPFFLGQLFLLLSLGIGTAASARSGNKSDAGPLHRVAEIPAVQPYGEQRAGPGANRLLHAPQAGPAAGANITWTSCAAGTLLNVSSSNTATYTFGSGDCDGNGFTAICEATGGNVNSQPRVLISVTSSNNILRFDRNFTSGTPAVVTAAHFKSTAGDLFMLTNLTIFPINAGTQTLTVTGYKAGVAVPGSTITINYVTSTPIHGTTLTTADFGSSYNSIDEIQATSSLSFGLSLDNIQTTAAVVLPVTFTYFNGRSEGNNVLLNWGTAIESNVKNFEIERSTDGSTFAPQGWVNSKAMGGNSVSPLDYSYTDPLNGFSSSALFYRLKESDLDGRANYSPVLKMTAPAGSLALSVYPNPFRQQVTITVESPLPDKAVITVTDLTGRKLLEQVSPLQKGSNILSLSALSQLGKGMYLFTIAAGQQKRSVGLIKLE